jgi:hypothetical protein
MREPGRACRNALSLRISSTSKLLQQTDIGAVDRVIRVAAGLVNEAAAKDKRPSRSAKQQSVSCGGALDLSGDQLGDLRWLQAGGVDDVCFVAVP